ncbi:MAG: bifunctional UDP-N-acetylglucosamine diphosphorylase/glucosamine-1-phosphate N-acetyltransferase GlmU, partial [Bdellovibrionales bacterium]
NGDHPLLETSDIEKFHKDFKTSKAGIAVITCELKDPASFGRVVRHNGLVRAIVEAKDASHETKKIKEINTGIYVVNADILIELLPRIRSHNAQNEFYLTDLIALAVEEGVPVEGIRADARVALGVNNQEELSRATRMAFKRKAARLMESGVVMLEPRSAFIEDGVEIAPAAVIYPSVHMRGKTKIGAYSCIESGCVIVDSTIAENVHVKSGCYIEGSKVATNAELGPYAHLRPGTEIGEECKVGNFVEMKKVKFGKGAKASHLTYLGDAEVGENTNIGCGTITCNYGADRKKHFTKIGKDVFVGSDTQFIAPITIGDGSYIGSGSTVTKDVPAGALAVSRAKQVIVENYVPRVHDDSTGKEADKKEK